MRPSLTENDFADQRLGDAKLSSYFRLRDTSSAVHLADGANVLSAQDVEPVASFGIHVVVVVRPSTKPQVRWVNAGSYVASMENAEPFWNCAVGQLPGRAMGAYFSELRSQTDLSVTSTVLETKPEDAAVRIRWPYVPSKSLGQWCRALPVTLHRTESTTGIGIRKEAFPASLTDSRDRATLTRHAGILQSWFAVGPVVSATRAFSLRSIAQAE